MDFPIRPEGKAMAGEAHGGGMLKEWPLFQPSANYSTYIYLRDGRTKAKSLCLSGIQQH